MTKTRLAIGHDIPAQLERLQLLAPALYDLVDPVRARGEAAVAVDPDADDFRSDGDGGRGTSYVRAQRNTATRSRGIHNLTSLFREGTGSPRPVVVDLLGGDGLVSQVVHHHLGITDVTFLTCDASPDMVTSAWDNGVAALRQSAQRQLLRDDSVDGVLLAYGSHHVPPEERLEVAREAWRVLRPGGLFVLHDFGVGSPVDTWFSDVVHPYSATGHDLAHFTPDEIRGYLRTAGFHEVAVDEMDDSFSTSGPSITAAEVAMGRYLVDMYGLEKLRDRLGEPDCYRRAFDMADRIFRYPEGDGSPARTTFTTDPGDGSARVVLPRRALVGIGRKPLTGSRPA
ncbi:class I SAM-dependent methyltransferase [Streptomyces sp. NPDC055607]